MKISHIVTNGCSFTYGDGLDDRENEVWPFVLGNKLGVDTVNIARSGSGNDRICRRTYEYFYEDIKNNNHPLYVIMFSAINRQDRWIENKQTYEVISPVDNDPVAKDFVYNSNRKVFFRNYMLYRMALKNLFEAYNIPYIFYLSIEILENLEQKEKMAIDMTNLLPNQYQLFANDIHYAGDASIITSGYPRTKCMHWGPLGHEALATHAYNKINQLYPELEKTGSKEYLTDLNFIKKAEPWYRHLYYK